MLAMIYKVGLCAERSWRRLRGFEWLAKIVDGVKFHDGVEVQNVVRSH
jgi:putative transposase